MRQLILTIGLTCATLIVLGQQTNEFDSDRFSVKIGYSVFQHLEPQIYGQNQNTQSTTVFDGNLSGIQAMNGITVKAHYFSKTISDCILTLVLETPAIRYITKIPENRLFNIKHLPILIANH